MDLQKKYIIFVLVGIVTNANDKVMETSRYQIFISSTYEDLKDERTQIIETIQQFGHIPYGMEYFVATDDTQWEWIKNAIEKSSYFILIIGGRYGSVDKTTNKSYTEKEYDYAVELGIPIIRFVPSNIDKLPLKKKETDHLKRHQLDSFINKVREDSDKLCCNYKSSSDLAAKVSSSLMKLFEKKLPYVAYMPYRNNAISDNNIKLDKTFDFKQINDKILKSETVEMFGLSFSATFHLLERNYKDLKAKCKFLLMANDGHSVYGAALRNGEDLDGLKQNCAINYGRITSMSKYESSFVELRTIDILPHFNLFIFDRDKETAHVIVHIHGWRCPAFDSRPIFEIVKNNNSVWFNYFVDQFDQMWNASK